MDSRADPGADPGFLSVGGGGGVGSRPDRQNTGSAHGTNTYVRMLHTYACTDRHMHVLAQADGWTYMYMYRRQTRRQVIYNMHNHVQRRSETYMCVHVEAYMHVSLS